VCECLSTKPVCICRTMAVHSLHVQMDMYEPYFLHPTQYCFPHQQIQTFLRKTTYCGKPAFSVRLERVVADIDTQISIKKNIMKDPSLGTYAPRKFNPQGMADMGQVEVAVIGSNWCDLQ